MATISSVHTNAADDNSVTLITWETLTSTDTSGSQVNLSKFPDKTIHVTGTYGAATVVIQGSNDGTNWVTLTDVHGTSLSTTADILSVITESPLYLRPTVTSADGSTDIDIYLVARTPNILRN